MKKTTIKARDGYVLNVHLSLVESPKALVQIAHGMEEHQDRYNDFIKFLNENGYDVVSADMRGHGKNVELLGYMPGKNVPEELVHDMVAIRDYALSKSKANNVYLFAHSMGTIISRALLTKYSSLYRKVVLSGYPVYNGACSVGILLTKLVKLFKGEKSKSNLLENLAVGSFNKAITNPRTPLDWLSYNEENVDKYIKDPYCGVPFSVNSYLGLFGTMKMFGNPKNYKNVSQIEIMYVSGKDDPCTGGDKGCASSISIMEKAGFKTYSRIDYEGMRHEILNEVEHQRVYDDVLEFLNK